MPREEPRQSAQTLRVLRTLLLAEESEMAGAAIGRAAKLQSGTLYPLLWRLEEAGWLTSRWEDGDPKDLGRPRRRYYQITGVGKSRARAALEELGIPAAGVAWA